MKRKQLRALLALFVLRESQTADELTASLGVFWKVTSEFDLSSLPDAVRGVMYMADLLVEGEENQRHTASGSWLIWRRRIRDGRI